VTNEQSWQLQGVLWPAVALVTIVGVDLALGVDVPLNGSYALAAVLAAALATRRTTAVVGIAAVVVSVASGMWNDNFATTSWSVRLMLCVGLALMAYVLADIKDRREAALRHMTVVATTAQRALLRAVPREVGPLAVATRYVSATHEALVGGDLYEVVASPYGVRVLVGDVRGKGLDAVQLAGTVLGAFRKSAYEQPTLPALAHDLDVVVAAVGGDEDFVTALVAEFHNDGTVTLVNCAHHEPVLVTADGSSRLVTTGEPVPPLGMAPTPTAVTTRWPTGSRMLLYTDGLVEARDRSGAFFDLSSNAPALVEGDLEEALDRMLDALTRHGGPAVRDDLALLLVENRAG
jgi:serine phosphatase RsbU (regulator of sigma subunit)